MIPRSIYKDIDLSDAIATTLPSKTYRVDPINKTVFGSIDNTQALLQAADKIVNTERFAYEIYNDQYGAEIEPLIGKDKAYVNSVIKAKFEEALLADDRFISVDDVVITDIDISSLAAMVYVTTVQGPLVFTSKYERGLNT